MRGTSHEYTQHVLRVTTNEYPKHVFREKQEEIFRVITLGIGTDRPLHSVDVASDQCLHCLPCIQQYFRFLKR